MIPRTVRAAPRYTDPMTSATPNADYTRQLGALAARLREHDGPLILLAHESPDGDAVGSLLGLSRGLRALGKDARPYGPVPGYLRFLLQGGGAEASRSDYAGERLEAWPEGAIAVVLDVDPADAERVAGADLTDFRGEVLNLDHHVTNKRQADLAVVNPERAAAAVMVAELLRELGAQLTPDIATPLLLGTVTDTGSFRHSNTDAHTLRIAAELLEAGGSLRAISEGLEQRSPASFALQHRVLGTLEFSHGGEVVSAVVNDTMLQESGAGWDDAEALVGLIRSAAGTRLAVLYKDRGGAVKLSLRSRGGVSARNIAEALGGGGHEPAAGATVSGSLDDARAALEPAIAAELERAGVRG